MLDECMSSLLPIALLLSFFTSHIEDGIICQIISWEISLFIHEPIFLPTTFSRWKVWWFCMEQGGCKLYFFSPSLGANHRSLLEQKNCIHRVNAYSYIVNERHPSHLHKKVACCSAAHSGAVP